MQRLVGALLVALLGLTFLTAASPLAPKWRALSGTAYAEDAPKEWFLTKVMWGVLKRVFRQPGMSDDDFKDYLNERIEDGFAAYDEYVSTAETEQRISSHCWRVYSWYISPPPGGTAYFSGVVPGEYGDGSIEHQLDVCVRAGKIPVPGSANTYLVD